MKLNGQPDPIILREIAIIFALLMVNWAMEIRYSTTIDFSEPDQTGFFVDSAFVYTPPKEQKKVAQQAQQQQPQHASTILNLVDDLFKWTEPKKQNTLPQGLGPIKPISIKTQANEYEKVDSFVSNLPQFPGGHQALQKYVEEHFYFTPAMYEYGRDLEVVLNFVVRSNGEITDIQVVRVNVSYVGLQKRATELIANMPKWIPGNNGGRPLNVHVQLPLTIQIW